jgi:hypothetical protein
MLTAGPFEPLDAGDAIFNADAHGGRIWKAVAFVAGPSAARNPDSITMVSEHGFATRRCAAIRND